MCDIKVCNLIISSQSILRKLRQKNEQAAVYVAELKLLLIQATCG